MTKFIKAVHGNVSSGGKYFMEGISTPVEDSFASTPEIVSMASKGYLVIFSSMQAATNHSFTTMAQKAKAGITTPTPVTAASNAAAIEAAAAKTAAEVKAKAEHDAKVAADEKKLADAKTIADAAAAALATAQAAAAADEAPAAVVVPTAAPASTEVAPTK